MKIRARFLVFIAAVACDKPAPRASPSDAGAAANSSATGASTASASASTSASAASANAASTGTWTGTYKSVAGSLYYPTDAPNGKEWKDFKWQGDDAGAGLGEGAMTLTIDPGGHVSGTTEGPLGAATLNGVIEHEQISAKVDRKDLDRGLTGTATGKVTGDKGDKIEGTMRLSLPEANVLRAVTFSLEKK